MKNHLVKFRWFAFGMLILGLVVAAFGLVTMRAQILEIGDGAAAAPTWYVTSLERDVQKLHTTLAEFQLDGATAAEVNLRFDILWSRANGSVSGTISAELASFGVSRQIFEDVMGLLRANEAIIVGIETTAEEDLAAFRAELSDLTEVVRDLSLRVLQARADNTNTRREALLQLSTYNAAIGIMITAILFLLLLLLVIEGLRTRRSLREKDTLLEAAEAANIAKSQFISVVNHELRTPLTSIKGAISLMGAGALGAIPKRFERPLHIAERNCAQLNALITDLLDVEKFASGHMEYHHAMIELVPFLTEQVEANTSYAQVFDTQLKLADDLPQLRTIGDPHRLAQVMANLISNAAKFSSSGGEVIVSLKQREDRAVISVTDFGRGIPETDHARIFERFQQVDSSNERERGGTGLGLAIIKSVVEAHGGTISFDSTVGEGTTFHFDLPLAP